MLFIDDPAPTEIYTLSLHDALPILPGETGRVVARGASAEHWMLIGKWDRGACRFSGRGSSFPEFVVLTLHAWTSSRRFSLGRDRKSTRLNSSHVAISYAVFCLKKKI